MENNSLIIENKALKTKVATLAAQNAARTQSLREQLHANPELSFEEYQTAAFVRKELADIGISDIQEVAGTGTVALLYGKKAGRTAYNCLALRADIDALPIQEKNLVDYCSKNEGCMHACGHDAHTAFLLGAARVLKSIENEWAGCIKLIFQQGEEQDPGGASLLIAAGVLTCPQVDLILGLHCDPDMEVGEVGFCAGAAMAATDEVYIDVYGHGGHGARPHQCVDTVLLAAQIINALQQLVSRRADPLSPSVLTFGKIYSEGGATNIIPDCVRIWGTFRSFDEAWRAKAHLLIRQIAEHTALAGGGRADVRIPEGYPSVYNAPELMPTLAAITANYGLQPKNIPPRMGGEDFGFYSQKVKAFFYRVGTKTAGGTGLHTATFDVAAEAMPTYAGLVAYVAANLMQAEN